MVLVLFPQVNLVVSRPVSIPDTFNLVNVTDFPFYQKLTNPCGININTEIPVVPSNKGFEIGGKRSESTVTSESTKDNKDEESSYFTWDYLHEIGAGINLTINALENLEAATKDVFSCDGISINSLPASSLSSPDSSHELDPMQEAYKSGIFLLAHLNIMKIDRESSYKGSKGRLEEDFIDVIPAEFVVCGDEPFTYVHLIQELIEMMESLLCTLVSGASVEERASFQNQRGILKNTKIYQYQSSCFSLQARDCVVIHEVRRALTAFKKQIRNAMHQIASINSPITRETLPIPSVNLKRKDSHQKIVYNVLSHKRFFKLRRTFYNYEVVKS